MAKGYIPNKNLSRLDQNQAIKVVLPIQNSQASSAKVSNNMTLTPNDTTFELYNRTCFDCSRLVTNRYSTSFSLGIKMLDKCFHTPIYSIYGFVRFVDEIVDTFHEFPKEKLLGKFEKDAYDAIKEGISLNPILQSFQKVVRKYGIEKKLIAAFLKSMRMDLYEQNYNEINYEEYIYGSAEVVGLMCLQVFCEGNNTLYDSLVKSAQSLGAAFQKVNFLRDIRSDFDERGRTYFPNVSFQEFDELAKKAIEKDIQQDFDDALEGIKRLPEGARFGVYTAYRYYLALFEKIKKSSPDDVLGKRIRVEDIGKFFILSKSWLRYKTIGM